MSLDSFESLSHDHPESKTWIVVFSDLIALCLTFFILVFSMSKIDAARWDVMTKGQNPQTGIKYDNKGEDQKVDSYENQISKKFEMEAQGLKYLESLLREQLTSNEELKEITLTYHSDRLVLTLPSDMLFEPGKATLNQIGEERIYLISSLVKNLRNRIDIIGHTDPDDIQTSNFPSNWELSLARAKTIADYLKGSGYLDSINIFGLADSRFGEITENLDKKEKYQKARRVEIEIREQALSNSFSDVR